MKKLLVIGKSKIADTIRKYFQNEEVELLTDVGSSAHYDLAVFVHSQKLLPNSLNIHPSLLPAFDNENPILDAFMAGVKVTGVTIHDEKGKIITQYPILIGNLTHFDELEAKIEEIEEKIYPIVIEKVLNDEVFDFDDLFKPQGCGGCSNGGCNNCKH